MGLEILPWRRRRRIGGLRLMAVRREETRGDGAVLREGERRG